MKKLYTALPLVFLLCFAFGCQQGEEVAEEPNLTDRLPIIDVHVHAYPALKGENPSWLPIDLDAPKTDEELMNENLKRFKQFNIVKVVAFGSETEKWKNKAPELFLTGWQNNISGNHEEHLASLRKDIINGRIDVIGEILAQYSGLAPNDPLLEPYYALAEELDVPFGIHVGPGPPGYAYNNAPNYRMRHGKPLHLEDILVKHPKLRLYVMHAGWPLLDEMVALMFFYPNVYVDISALNWFGPRDEFHFYLRRLVQAGFGKRIMFGSDQMFWPEAIELAIEGVESADFLSEEQKRDIFYNNAVRFFRLED